MDHTGRGSYIYLLHKLYFYLSFTGNIFMYCYYNDPRNVLIMALVSWVCATFNNFDVTEACGPYSTRCFIFLLEGENFVSDLELDHNRI